MVMCFGLVWSVFVCLVAVFLFLRDLCFSLGHAHEAHDFTFTYPYYAMRHTQLTDVTDTNRHSIDSWTTHQTFVCLVGDFYRFYHGIHPCFSPPLGRIYLKLVPTTFTKSKANNHHLVHLKITIYKLNSGTSSEPSIHHGWSTYPPNKPTPPINKGLIRPY